MQFYEIAPESDCDNDLDEKRVEAVLKKYLIIAAAVLAVGSASPVQAMTKEHLSRNAEIRKELAADSPINSLYLAVDESEYLADGEVRTVAWGPYIRDGRTYVPLSLMEEAFGLPVTWNLQDFSAILMWRGNTLRISLPENKIYYKGEAAADISPDVVPGSGVAVPIVEVLTALDIPYQWLPETSSLFVYQKNDRILQKIKLPERMVSETKFVEEFLKYLAEQAQQQDWIKHQTSLLELAKSRLGMPYVGGAAGPNAFDCSGFVHWVLTTSGTASYTRGSSQSLFALCEPIAAADLKVGDLVFFTRTYSTKATVTHSAIYIGDGQMIHAAGNRVQITPLSDPYWANHFYAYGRMR